VTKRIPELVFLILALLPQGCGSSKPLLDTKLYSTAAGGGGYTSPDTLITVDQRGQQAAVAQAGRTPAQDALAFDPRTGALYGVQAHSSGSPNVVRIDPVTGDTTAVDLQDYVTGMAFSPAGQAYVVINLRTLATADLATGTLAPLSANGDLEIVYGIEFGGDGTFYAVGQRSPNADHDELVTLNPTTGTVTSSVALSNFYKHGDLAWHPDGHIYATNGSAFVLQIDPRSGNEIALAPGNPVLGALGGLAAWPVRVSP